MGKEIIDKKAGSVDLAKQNTTLITKNKDLADRLSATLNENKALSGKYEKQISDLQSTLKQKDTQINSFKVKAQEAERLKTDLEARMKELATLRQNLENEKAMIKSVKAENTALVKTYEGRLSELGNTLKQREGEIGVLQANAKEAAALKTELKQVTKEMNALHSEISSKKTTIDTLLNEKSALKAILSDRDILINDKESAVAVLEGRLTDLQSAFKQQEERFSMDLAARNGEIEKLNKRIQEILGNAPVDAALIQQLNTLQLQHSSLRIFVEEAEKERTRLKLDAEAFKERALAAEKEFSKYKDLYIKENTTKRGIQDELDAIKTKLQASFSYADVAAYFKNTIDQFNNKMKTEAANGSVDYILSDVDVELKTGLGKNDKNEMIVSPPLFGGNDDSYSLIKMSIRAVPHMREAEK